MTEEYRHVTELVTADGDEGGTVLICAYCREFWPCLWIRKYRTKLVRDTP